ncbi:hypothetical protein N8303_07330 [Gammaproteobacteria bacterium]|nr:hypothetical protein [Gammaproteobacteria bacterium]
MLLEQIYFIAEIISAIAVILSLVYVGYQIKLNTAEKRVDSVQSIISGWNRLTLIYIENEEVGEAWRKVMGREELNNTQLNLMAHIIFAHLMLLEEVYNKYQAGYLDDEFLNARIKVIQFLLLNTPQVRELGAGMIRGGIFTQSFVNWLEIELQKSKMYDETPELVKS